MLVEHEGSGLWAIKITYEQHEEYIDAIWHRLEHPIYASRAEAEAAIAALPVEDRTGYEADIRAVEVACTLCDLGEESCPDSKNYGEIADRLGVDFEVEWPSATIKDRTLGVKVPLGKLGSLTMSLGINYCPCCGRHIS